MLSLNERELNMLIFFISVAILTLSHGLYADELHTFQAGQFISANEINENFSKVSSRTDELSTQTDEIFSNDIDYTPTVMGLSDPKVFGQVSFNEGISACSVKYENSHICSFTDLNRAKKIPYLDNSIPAFIIKRSNGGNNHKLDIGLEQQICEDFFATDESNVVLYIGQQGEIIMNNDGTYLYEYSRPDFILEWVESKNLVGSDGIAQRYENADSYWQSSGSTLRYYACNTTMPTLCCK